MCGPSWVPDRWQDLESVLGGTPSPPELPHLPLCIQPLAGSPALLGLPLRPLQSGSDVPEQDMGGAHR